MNIVPENLIIFIAGAFSLLSLLAAFSKRKNAATFTDIRSPNNSQTTFGKTIPIEIEAMPTTKNLAFHGVIIQKYLAELHAESKASQIHKHLMEINTEAKMLTLQKYLAEIVVEKQTSLSGVSVHESTIEPHITSDSARNKIAMLRQQSLKRRLPATRYNYLPRRQKETFLDFATTRTAQPN